MVVSVTGAITHELVLSQRFKQTSDSQGTYVPPSSPASSLVSCLKTVATLASPNFQVCPPATQQSLQALFGFTPSEL